jgi:hypothetical protein
MNMDHNVSQQRLQLGTSPIIYNTTPTPDSSVPCSLLGASEKL